MSALFANNASSRLYAGVDAISTSIRVLAGEGAKFPAPTGGDFFMVTIEDRRSKQIEICKCTGRSGDILNVLRAQEGTPAQAFEQWATVSNRITAGTVTAFAGVPEVEDDGKVYGREFQLWVETIRKTTYDAFVTAQDARDDAQDARLDAVTNKNATQDARLDAVEAKNTEQDAALAANTTKDNEQDAAIAANTTAIGVNTAKNTEQDARLNANDTKNSVQDSRLDAVEAKNVSQDADIAGKVPEAPNDGITYGRKNSTWVASVGGAVVSESAPTGPIIGGQLWWESDSGNLFVYYNDGDSSQWVQVSNAGGGGGGGGSSVPVGSIVDFAGDVTPQGWMLCFGQTMSRVLYPALFTAIGTAFGAGDGSTTFNLPDCRGRVAAGKDDMGGTSANRLTTLFNGDLLGAAGGVEIHTLAVTEMPSHTHAGVTGAQSVDHSHSGSSGYVSADHVHNNYFNSGGRSAYHTHSDYGTSSNVLSHDSSADGDYSMTGTYTRETSVDNGDHVHLVSGNTGGINTNHYHSFTSGGASVGHTHSVSAQGGGLAHNNLQPTIVFNKMIKVV